MYLCAEYVLDESHWKYLACWCASLFLFVFFPLQMKRLSPILLKEVWINPFRPAHFCFLSYRLQKKKPYSYQRLEEFTELLIRISFYMMEQILCSQFISILKTALNIV